jgi:hypothetical protein
MSRIEARCRNASWGASSLGAGSSPREACSASRRNSTRTAISISARALARRSGQAFLALEFRSGFWRWSGHSARLSHGRPSANCNAYEFARLDFFCGAPSQFVTEFVVFSKTPLAIVFCSQVCRDGRRGIRSLYRPRNLTRVMNIMGIQPLMAAIRA